MADSINYYDKNVEEFVSGTLDVDVSDLYARFLKHVPLGGHILDAGCGSGRDVKYFLEQGYRVTAFDGSKEMVSSASNLTGLQVQHQQFDEVYCQQVFDGIWACASVLHVTKKEMAEVVNKLRHALKDQGVLYLSYKYGDSEEVRKDRHFSNYTEESFTSLLKECHPLQVMEMWTTQDSRPDRQDERWLNVLLRVL
jgi:cyclopropane fatty-acyl-phospholipid synthase-like methyltransferase